MSAARKLLRRIEGGYFIHCPACKTFHVVAVEKPLSNGAQWSFNGDLKRPTFSPSLSVKTGRAVDPNFVPEPGDPPEHCHSFIRDGQIEFCSDSTHELAGKTVPLLEWTEGDGE
ncbi:DUF6527 family protein [Brevundimonas sp.]|uniref:DUF6527 family protein n=1 Tax=Brevundimonas sp. TaxID=1871086 RepID=UPI002899B8BE|nr:DUF6527 family protein [Brevundimonas sp.]